MAEVDGREQDSENNLSPAPPKSRVARVFTPWLSGALALLGLIWVGEILLNVGIALFTEQVISAFLGLSLAIIFLNVPAKKGNFSDRLPPLDAALAVLGFAVGWYLFFRYPTLAEEFYYLPVETSIVGGLAVLLVIEALRRSSGWSIFTVFMVFVAYALLGHLIPGDLAGRSLAPGKFFAFMGIDNVALLGLPLTVICNIVIVFIFMGQILLQSGGSAFFTDAASAIMGKSRGGSAKIAVVASGLFGSISGSAVSNVASTGVITIPLMRQGGYSRKVAGAVEAVASTGGQIMPPIMGTAAFLMAELLEVEYREVVAAAILPALLYYVSVFLQTDLEAGRRGISPLPKDRIPAVAGVFRQGWYFLVPFAVLLYALFEWNSPPEKAALWAVASIAVLGSIFSYRGHRLTPRVIVRCLIRTGGTSVDIIVIGAVAGMILGVIDVTGLGFGLTFILVQLGEGNLFYLLVLTAVVCIILGMGMPTTAIYFLLATLAAPPLIKLGVEPMAAHLFVLYFGLLSMISPPVALAAFTAAKLADAGPMETAMAACKLGWPAFVVPFLFVISPNLLMQGDVLDIAIVFVTAIVGIWFASAGATGFFLNHLNAPQRIAYIIGGLSLLLPSQAFASAYLIEIAGFVICAATLLTEYSRRRRAA